MVNGPDPIVMMILIWQDPVIKVLITYLWDMFIFCIILWSQISGLWCGFVGNAIVSVLYVEITHGLYNHLRVFLSLLTVEHTCISEASANQPSCQNLCANRFSGDLLNAFFIYAGVQLKYGWCVNVWNNALSINKLLLWNMFHVYFSYMHSFLQV